ncbi:hypothetical protein Clacol_009593 [Clathrus columnatus]|uniref:N-acetyltransferase domain-containing protein n=1 Tax=Clathrus columnatus TaxID=1419009 RepID=A0AAV5AKX3_9AGAM|nr:hypothetical protein Clacol_009593 [Clathrus columnatus]
MITKHRNVATFMMANLESIKIQSVDCEETWPIRRAVLYPRGPEEGIHIPGDEKGLHFGAFLISDPSFPDKLQLTSVISLFYDKFPSHLTPLLPNITCTGNEQFKALRFRKFATLNDFQNQGIGSRLFQFVVDHARDDSSLGPGTIVWCAARRSAQDWYIKRGMRVFGDSYFKNGIEFVTMAIII